jgi:hypothetical protein
MPCRYDCVVRGGCLVCHGVSWRTRTYASHIGDMDYVGRYPKSHATRGTERSRLLTGAITPVGDFLP